MSTFIIRFVLIALLAAVALPALANGTAGTTQASYWMVLVEVFTKLVFLIMALLSLTMLTLLCIKGWKTVRDSGGMRQNQDPDSSPLTLGKLLGGLFVVVSLYLPLQTMTFFGDFMGLARTDTNSSLCMVTEVSVSHFNWTNNASGCINHLKKKVKEFAGYTEDAHIESANLPLLFGVVQLLGLAFFASSAWMLGKHFLGARNLKVTPGMALIAMFASSAVMMAPNAIDYIQDVRGAGADIVSPPQG